MLTLVLALQESPVLTEESQAMYLVTSLSLVRERAAGKSLKENESNSLT